MIYFLRAPESDGRPEKWMADSILAEINAEKLSVVELKAGQYATLGGESYFYGTSSYFDMVDQIKALLLYELTSDDVVFFMDVWNPAIPLLLSELRLRESCVPKLVGYCHGSSGVLGDLYYGYAPAVYYESYLNSVMAQVYVPTEYSSLAWAQKAQRLRASCAVVTGSPLRMPVKASNAPKNNKVVFAHRLVPEKGRHLLPYLAERLKDVGLQLQVLTPSSPVPDYLSTCLVDVCQSKGEYLDHLSQARYVISLADMETFGYAIYEGWLAGATPIVPRTACYPYLWSEDGLYDWHGRTEASVDAAVNAIQALEAEDAIRRQQGVEFLGLPGEENIVKHLKDLM
jgi:glycosyltransferase involved in cell wall biosynthesis